jgi:hypothetical protein
VAARANPPIEATARGSIPTWAGTITVLATPAGIRCVDLPRWNGASPPDASAARGSVAPGGDPTAEAHLRRALAELAAYFAGRSERFTVALDPAGTNFLRAA